MKTKTKSNDLDAYVKAHMSLIKLPKIMAKKMKLTKINDKFELTFKDLNIMQVAILLDSVKRTY